MNERIAAVEIVDLSFSYPDGHPALRQVHLTVAPGERVALVGPNGAGKSTLLLQLNGILRGQGHVRIHGLEVAEENIRRIRALVGLVFQDPDDQLFSPTVYEDVAFGPIYMGLPLPEIQERVQRSLAQVGMADYAQRTPHHLSVGEKKRVALATVLSMDATVLALDEPSAGLDPRARGRLIRLLKTLPQTLLVSSHDLHLVEALCPRMVIMQDGRIVADGDSARMLHDEELLARHCLSEGSCE